MENSPTNEIELRICCLQLAQKLPVDSADALISEAAKLLAFATKDGNLALPSEQATIKGIFDMLTPMMEGFSKAMKDADQVNLPKEPTHVDD